MSKKPMTFGEYLAWLMSSKRITAMDLTRRLNYRSKTSVSRILRDEVRYSSIEDFVSRLEPMEEWLLSPEERLEMRQAMEVSRLGRARYQAYRDVWRLVQPPKEAPGEIRLESFGSSQAQSLSELTQRWYQAEKLSMTIINSGYDSLFRQIRDVLEKRPGLQADIRHYLAVDDAAGSMAEQLAALIHVFQDARYHGYYRSGYTGRNVNQNAINDFVVAQIRMPDGSNFTQMIYMLAENRAMAYESVSEEGFGDLFRRVMSQVQPNALPIKRSYPQMEKMDWLIQITNQYLNCERDRSIFCLTPDVSFELIPKKVLERPMIGPVFDEEDMKNPRLNDLVRIHQARYDNLAAKRQMSSYILTLDGLRRFMETGVTTDRVSGMSPFTVGERCEILRDLIRRVRENVYLTVRILKPDVRMRGMSMTLYEGLGVHLLSADTQYDVTREHNEVFLLMPALTRTLTEFCREELIEKHAYSEAESLEILEKLSRESVAE